MKAAMTTVPVPLSAGRDYTIHIGSGLLAEAGATLTAVARSSRAIIITQPPIAKHWAKPLQESLCAAGFVDPDVILFPAGERYKTLATMASLCDKLYNLPRTIDRKTLVVALGGGVVGDVAGFVAASYLRGLDYVQVPTTLLAMVDSSIGGKTGVDFRAGKNLVGAFHQPRAVLADVDTLRTLPPREFRSGLGEVVKYGVIRDPALLDAKPVRAGDITAAPETVIEIIRRSCVVKADVVCADEREETGLRAILNYGHTIGHALESATHYRRFKHGEAIGIGMVSAACIGEVLGVTPTAVREKVQAAVQTQQLPGCIPNDIEPDTLLALLGRDKKAEDGVARFVLAHAVGDVELMGQIRKESVLAGLALQQSLCTSARIEEIS